MDQYTFDDGDNRGYDPLTLHAMLTVDEHAACGHEGAQLLLALWESKVPLVPLGALLTMPKRPGIEAVDGLIGEGLIEMSGDGRLCVSWRGEKLIRRDQGQLERCWWHYRSAERAR